MPTIAFYITTALDDAVRRYAQERQISVSSIIRECVEKVLIEKGVEIQTKTPEAPPRFAKFKSLHQVPGQVQAIILNSSEQPTIEPTVLPAPATAIRLEAFLNNQSKHIDKSLADAVRDFGVIGEIADEALKGQSDEKTLGDVLNIASRKE